MISLFKKNDKAFTLIELMIVVVVIVILATMILVALSGARGTAEDSRRRGAVSQIRSFSSVHYSVGGSYEGLKEANDISDLIDKYDIDTGEKKVLQILVSENGMDFCAEIELTEGEYFCTDRTYKIVDNYTERRCTIESINCEESI